MKVFMARVYRVTILGMELVMVYIKLLKLLTVDMGLVLRMFYIKLVMVNMVLLLATTLLVVAMML